MGRRFDLPLHRVIIARPLFDDPALGFAAWSEPAVVAADIVEGVLVGLRAELRGGAGVWSKIQSQALFCLEPGVLGPIFGGAFHPGLPFHFTVALDPALVPALGEACGGDPEALADELRALDEGHPARDHANWRMISVMQPHGSVEFGATTRYFDAELSRG